MAEDCRAVVPGIAAFDTEAAGQERIAPRGIHQIARLPVLRAAVLALRRDARATLPPVTRQLNTAHAAAFDHVRAGMRGVADQDLIEL